MPYRSLNIQEAARMLGADARRVERMAQRGVIPCQKVAGQFRFNRAEMTEWLQENLGTMNHRDLAEVDAGITEQRQAEEDELIVAPLLRFEAITTDLDARTKPSVIRALLELAQRTGCVLDEQELLGATMHREELCSTALEGGIAIPHSRRPLPYAISEPILVVARTTQPIVFGAPDGKLTQLFFLTVSLDDHHHVHLLARLCRMLHDERFVARLQGAETPEETMDLMKTREHEVLAE